MQQEFIDAVNNKDVSSVRFALSNELLLDPRGFSFDEMRQLAESKLSDLYEADAPLTFDTDKSNWNEDFLFSVKNNLDMEFTKNKLDFYKKVALYVMRDKIEALNEEERRGREIVVSQEPTDNGSTNSFDSKKIILIIVVAIVFLIVMVRSCGSSDSSSDKKQNLQKDTIQTEQTK